MTNQRGLDEIWQDDRFDRREDAIAIQAFIESVWDREKAIPQGRAYTLAVDATYGVGKTFFLKRLEEHLSLNHPVAYVDAWRDDLADDPLVALLATLKAALKDYIGDSKPLADKWKAVSQNAGKIAKVAGKGLSRRLLMALLTGGAVSEIEELLDGASEEVVTAAQEGVKATVDGSLQDIAGAIQLIRSGSSLDRRIEEFDEGAQAIADLKDSLRELVQSLDNAPIVVIVDELDRCRPNYAVKLLEEVKHLFDVQGLVFIFGLHGDQLAKSICAEYGEGFDGEHYLRRFINRTYSLPDPDLESLVEQYLVLHGLEDHHFANLLVKKGNQAVPQNGKKYIAQYLNAYGLTARDALSLLDAMQLCVALAQGIPIMVPHLLPTLINNLKLQRREHDGQRPYFIKSEMPSHSRSGYSSYSNSISNISEAYSNCVDADWEELYKLMDAGSSTAGLFTQLYQGCKLDPISGAIGHPRNYDKLITQIGRFGNNVATSSSL